MHYIEKVKGTNSTRYTYTIAKSHVCLYENNSLSFIFMYSHNIFFCKKTQNQFKCLVLNSKIIKYLCSIYAEYLFDQNRIWYFFAILWYCIFFLFVISRCAFFALVHHWTHKSSMLLWKYSFSLFVNVCNWIEMPCTLCKAQQSPTQPNSTKPNRTKTY